MTVRRTPAGDALYRGALPFLQYAGMEYMLDSEAVRRLLLACRKAAPAEGLISQLEHFFFEKQTSSCDGSGAETDGATPFTFAKERAEFILLWCLKQDYVEVVRT